MQSMWMRIFTLLYLMINAVHDIRKKEILLWSVPVYTGAGLILSIVMGREIREILLAAGVGILAGIISLISGGAVGMGDVLVISSLSMMLYVWEIISILGMALLGAAIFSGILLVTKKAGRKTGIPFIPFLFAGYLGGLWIW